MATLSGENGYARAARLSMAAQCRKMTAAPYESDELPKMSATNLTQQYRERVWRIVHGIPRGKVTSYGAVAQLAGLPRGARLIGRMLAQLPEGSALPWHRVVNSRGQISFPQDSSAYREQRERLLAEGVPVRGGKIDLKQFGWSG